MDLVRRMLAAVFAGDRRVWRVAAVAAIPLVLLTGYYCAKPRFYFTGTDSVEDIHYLARTNAGQSLCVPSAQVPAHTAFIRLRVRTSGRLRPALQLRLYSGGSPISSQLAQLTTPADRITNADFPIPPTPGRPAATAATVCVSSGSSVTWAGTRLLGPPTSAPSLNGGSLAGRVAIWYLPRSGSTLSYLQRASEIMSRAALFRPGVVGAWTYWLLFIVLLPALALLAVRTLAISTAGRGRRLGVWLFAIAAANACCWALITPVFQGPDEVDHFAYVQSLVERGEGPSHNMTSPLQRWSGAENRALDGISFPTDHQVGDSRAPWLGSQQVSYEREVARLHPRRDDGGGYSTSAAHGPTYYLALAPAYAATRHASIFSQLTLMRLVSAFIGALVVLFTYLLVRELAPGRPWLAVLAALLVAFQPMYGFISGVVNNDVGVNACAAALELLLIRMLRRGITIPWAILTGVVLTALPLIKGTGLSLYPVAALAIVASLWRRRRSTDLRAILALVVGAAVTVEFSALVLSTLQPTASSAGSGAISSNANAASAALHDIPDYVAYVWQVFLPKLPFMKFHLHGPHAAFVIFVERGWGAFGWYDVLFPQKWIYYLLLVAMLLTVPLGIWAARREWAWLRRHAIEVIVLVATPVAVVLGFEAAYYSPHVRTVIPEFGRYAFPAIGALAALGVGALHAFGRNRMMLVGSALLVALISLSVASQLLTLTAFYA